MKSYTKKCGNLSKTCVEATFPSSKLWRQKNLTGEKGNLKMNIYVHFF